MNLSRAPSPSLDESNTLVADSWCNSQVNLVYFNYLWTISNFSFCPEQVGDVLLSSPFSPKANDKMVWRLRLYPKGLDGESSKQVSLYLVLEKCDKPFVFAKFIFTLLNTKRKDNKIVTNSKIYRFFPSKDWGFKKFVRQNVLFDESSGYLPDDTLTIFCEVTAVADISVKSGQTSNVDPVDFRIPECTLAEDLGSLFEMRRLCNVKLCVDGKEFYAHKEILAARSPVFAAMFRHQMLETELNSVIITDVDQEVLEELLRFIYTGTAGNLERMAEELLIAADKYAVDRLKIMCERSLYSNLDVENASDVLITAYMHNSTKLEEKTIDFINTNANDVMETEGWRSMVSFYPALVAKAFKAMALQRNFPVGPLRNRFFHNSTHNPYYRT